MTMQHCPLCRKGVQSYKCPVCGATAHVDMKTKTLTLHVPPTLIDPKNLRPNTRISACFPSHFDCELAKPITMIDLSKLVKAE